MRTLPLIAGALLIASCASPPTRVALSLPPKPADQVAVIHTLPTRPYQVVAEFQGIGLSESRIRAMGGKLGADAVYVSNYTISFAGNGTFAGPGSRQEGLNNEAICTAISYR